MTHFLELITLVRYYWHLLLWSARDESDENGALIVPAQLCQLVREGLL